MGCPGAEATLRNLLAVRAELGIPESEIELVEVTHPSLAERYRFQGSPTILVDGKDIVTGEEPSGFSYTCRIYPFDKIRPGVIPVGFIRQRMSDLRGG